MTMTTDELVADRRARKAAANKRWRYRSGRQQPRQPRLFDLQDLLDRLALRPSIATLEGMMRTAEENRQLGVNRHQRQRYAAQGLTATQADRLAIRAGLHPCECFADWWSSVDAETEQTELELVL